MRRGIERERAFEAFDAGRKPHESNLRRKTIFLQKKKNQITFPFLRFFFFFPFAFIFRDDIFPDKFLL